MHAVVLNLGAIVAAAAHVGILGERALSAHLGVPLCPVTLRLIAAVVTRLPITSAAACSVVEVPCSELPVAEVAVGMI